MALHWLVRRVSWPASLALVAVMAAGVARADIPPRRPGKVPGPPPEFVQPVVPPSVGQPTPFVVRQGTAQQSRLVIPRKFLPQVAPAKASAGVPADSAPRAATFGLMLAAVISGGGLAVVFVRRHKVSAAVATLVVALSGAASVGIVMASPPNADRPAPNLPPQLGAQSAVAATQAESPQIIVEVTETGDNIVLILGKHAPQFNPAP